MTTRQRQNAGVSLSRHQRAREVNRPSTKPHGKTSSTLLGSLIHLASGSESALSQDESEISILLQRESEIWELSSWSFREGWWMVGAPRVPAGDATATLLRFDAGVLPCSFQLSGFLLKPVFTWRGGVWRHTVAVSLKGIVGCSLCCCHRAARTQFAHQKSTGAFLQIFRVTSPIRKRPLP